MSFDLVVLVANPLVGTRPEEPVCGDVDESPVPTGVDEPPLPGTEMDGKLLPPAVDGVALTLPDAVGPALLTG